jgi:hypothetical protein
MRESSFTTTKNHPQSPKKIYHHQSAIEKKSIFSPTEKPLIEKMTDVQKKCFIRFRESESLSAELALTIKSSKTNADIYWILENFIQYSIPMADAIKLCNLMSITRDENFIQLIHAHAPRFTGYNQKIVEGEENIATFHPGVIISALAKTQEQNYDYSLSGNSYEVRRLLYYMMGRELNTEIDDGFMLDLQNALVTLRNNYPELAKFADSRTDFDLFITDGEKLKLRKKIEEFYGAKIEIQGKAKLDQVVKTTSEEPDLEVSRPGMRR